MNTTLWRSMTEAARRETWPALSQQEKQSLQDAFGPDPVQFPWPSRGAHLWPRTLAIVAMVICVVFSLFWWSGESQRRLDVSYDQREKIPARPGYQQGQEIGMVMGLGGAADPTDAALRQLSVYHARQVGRSEDTSWQLNFRIGYRDGLLQGRNTRR